MKRRDFLAAAATSPAAALPAFALVVKAPPLGMCSNSRNHSAVIDHPGETRSRALLSWISDSLPHGSGRFARPATFGDGNTHSVMRRCLVGRTRGVNCECAVRSLCVR